ncbi:hypothetical protein GBA65_12660 [Rubrobacter marinus]|uniref:Uncharacterized protein n=1 Tax=Rubrobacter marinus TaxID=2653852 RepID=A0A6G8PYF5_9ACTN|nr:hypothetical protein [Rubrobacter marinus]QIN79230.1 hypothetical protein GBA65_12660 [Rubrobacter marinus]
MEVRANEERISRTIYECRVYWVRSGVPRRRVDDMLSELERHLREAGEDGKPVEAVVGDDVRPFAKLWAEESRPPRELGRRLFIFATSVAISVPVFAAFTHLWYWTLSFGVDLGVLLPVVTFAVSVSLMGLFPALTTIEHLEPRWKGHLAIVVLSLTTVLVPTVIIALAFGGRDAALFDWSWYATLVSALVALLMYGLLKHSVPDVRAFVRRRIW